MTTSKITLNILGILIAVNIVGLFLYGYMLYRISSEKSLVNESLVLLNTERKKGDTLEGLNDVINDTVSEREKINSYFIDIKGSAKFLEKLQFFGESASTPIRLENVDVENKNVLTVNFSANGSFSQIHKLIKLLETTPYVIEIKSMNFNKINITDENKSKGSDNPWNINVKIRLLSFVNK